MLVIQLHLFLTSWTVACQAPLSMGSIAVKNETRQSIYQNVLMFNILKMGIHVHIQYICTCLSGGPAGFERRFVQRVLEDPA